MALTTVIEGMGGKKSVGVDFITLCAGQKKEGIKDVVMRVFLRNNSSTFWLINALFDAETILSCAKARLQALFK